jgi:hypothetical protein
MKNSQNHLRFTIFASMTAAVFVLSSLAADAGGKSLKASDIRALFPGNYEARVQGHKVHVVARRNGSLAGSAYSQTDNGRWWVSGNQLCFAWSSWADGKANCGRIVQSGSWYVSRNSAAGSLKFRRN